MQFITANSDLILRLLVAVGLGMVIGLERLVMHKDAGIKTHALVSLGAALFIIISEKMAEVYAGLPGFNPTMIASQIIVGIGFLGAGSIVLSGPRLLGLTTAGGLWVTAGIGMASGFGLFGLATITTALVLFILVIVYIVEQPIRKMSDEKMKDTQNWGS